MATQKSSPIILSILRLMCSRRWALATLLVFIASAVCIRLSIWQVERLQETRAINTHDLAVRSMSPLNLPATGDLTSMEYRTVNATGTYDFQDQFVTRDQYNGVQPGYHLFTPLHLSDGEAVLVDRGWIPSVGNSMPADWRQYDQLGTVTVSGVIRLGQSQPTPGSVTDPTLTPGQTRLDFWVYVNLDRIRQQIPFPLLPVYIQLTPVSNRTDAPIPIFETFDPTDGSTNLNYAIQWCLFAILFILAYGYYLWRKELRRKA
jgi:surfeit locus 1 family protein